MPQIINNGPGFGGQLGAALGGGISTGLQALAQHKLGQIIERSHRKQESENFQSAGFTPQESNFLASQPANLRPAYISQLRPYGAMQQGQPATQQLQQEAVTPQEQEAIGLESVLSSLQPRNPTNASQRELQRLYAGRSDNLGGLGIDSILKTNAPHSRLARVAPQSIDKKTTQAPEVTPKATRSHEPLVAGALTRRAAVKPSAAEIKQSREEVKDINKKYDAARNADMRISKMEKLIDSGKLNHPVIAGLAKTATKGIFGIGLNLMGLLSPESQEFDKLSTDFVKDAKDIFGSRLTNLDIETFLQTVPTLSQSNDGKRRVINNLKLFNEGAKIKKNAMDEIIDANGGVTPPNIESLVEKVAAPRLDALAERFKESEPQASSAQSTQYKDLPEAASVSGKKFRDKKSGEIVQSVDGKWVKVS